MIHVYKAGGEHQKDGIDYSIECINSEDIEFYTSNGWSDNLDDALSLVSEDDEEPEQEEEQELEQDEEQLKEKLRKEIEGITGEAPHWNCSLETLQSKLSELKDGTGNN